MIKSGKDIDLSSLCPQFVPDGLLLTLQVHGDRNSMMQNITYSPVDQDPFLSFSSVFCFIVPSFTTTIGAYWFSLRPHTSFKKKEKQCSVTPLAVEPSLDNS